MDPKSKLLRLKNFWRNQLHSCAIGFSGGVDSAFLVVTGLRWAKVELFPVFVDSVFVSEAALNQAIQIADCIGIETIRLRWNPLTIPEIIKNDRLRCYFCKKNLYLKIRKSIVQMNSHCSTIIDGTQADDLLKQRPGLFALQELEVQTPLADIGFTKTDIRYCLNRWGYAFWDLPAESCLATRFKYGKRLSEKEIQALNFELRYKKS